MPQQILQITESESPAADRARPRPAAVGRCSEEVYQSAEHTYGHRRGRPATHTVSLFLEILLSVFWEVFFYWQTKEITSRCTRDNRVGAAWLVSVIAQSSYKQAGGTHSGGKAQWLTVGGIDIIIHLPAVVPGETNRNQFWDSVKETKQGRNVEERAI